LGVKEITEAMAKASDLGGLVRERRTRRKPDEHP
jgi:hypothetical protein